MFFLVFLGHADLMVPGVDVEKTQQLTSGGRINQLVYAWNGKIVFGARLVKVDEIYDHLPLVVGFVRLMG